MSDFDDIIKGLRSDLKNASKQVEKKTSETIELSKLRVEKMKLRGKIQSCYEELGELVYGGYKNEEDVSEGQKALFEELDADFERIEEIYREVEAVKAGKALQKEEDEDIEEELDNMMEEAFEEADEDDEDDEVEVEWIVEEKTDEESN